MRDVSGAGGEGGGHVPQAAGQGVTNTLKAFIVRYTQMPLLEISPRGVIRHEDKYLCIKLFITV